MGAEVAGQQARRAGAEAAGAGGGVGRGGEVGVLGETEVVVRAEGADRPVGMDGVGARGSVETGQMRAGGHDGASSARSSSRGGRGGTVRTLDQASAPCPDLGMFHVERSSSLTQRSGRYDDWSTSLSPSTGVAQLRSPETEDGAAHAGPDGAPRPSIRGARASPETWRRRTLRSPPPAAPIRRCSTRTRSLNPISRTAVRRNATFFPVASTSVNRSFGRNSANGIAGRPPPEPTSTISPRHSTAPVQAGPRCANESGR